MTVLVAYASANGSTRDIAERLARRLSEAGLDACALPASAETGPAGYSAVVLGSAIHNGKWLPEATAWTRMHSAALTLVPTWLFSVSSVGDRESAFPPRVAALMRRARKTPAETREIIRLVHAREHRNFAGVVGGQNWSRAGRMFMAVCGGRTGDHRNWPAIDAWATEIAAQLLARGSPQAIT